MPENGMAEDGLVEGEMVERKWTEAEALKAAAQDLQSLALQRYITDPNSLLRTMAIIKTAVEAMHALSVASCGPRNPCPAGWHCCRDGLCRQYCDIAPNKDT